MLLGEENGFSYVMQGPRRQARGSRPSSEADVGESHDDAGPYRARSCAEIYWLLQRKLQCSAFGPSELKGPALQQWQQRGVEWYDEYKAKKDHARNLLKARREFVARARKEAAKMNKKKRACREEEDSQGSDECGWELEERRPQPENRSRVITAKCRDRASKRKASTPESDSSYSSSLSETDIESQEEEEEEEEKEKEHGEAPTRR